MRILLAFIFILIATVAQAQELPDQRPFLRIEAGMHTGTIRRAAISADGTLLATGSHDKTVRLWSLPQGRLIRSFIVPIDGGNGGKINGVALSPDGRTLVAGGWDINFFYEGEPLFLYVFDTISGSLINRIGPLPNVVLDLAFSPDGNTLAAGLYGKNGVRLWRRDAMGLFTGTGLADPDYASDIYGLAFSTQGDKLAVTSWDGQIRLYRTPRPGEDLMQLRPRVRVDAPEGKRPYGIAFSPDGKRLAVGYDDSKTISILDASSLAILPDNKVDTTLATYGNFIAVAWSADGETLYGGGLYANEVAFPVVAWPDRGRGQPQVLSGPRNTILDVLPLPRGGVAWGSHDPAFGLILPDGTPGSGMGPVTADMRGKRSGHFWNAPNGAAVWFGLGEWSEDPWIFDASQLTFEPAPERPASFIEPQTETLNIQNWINEVQPTIDAQVLPLDTYEISRSLAIAPDAQSFILGTEWSIYRFDARGQMVWRIAVPNLAWGVTLSQDGAILIAAFGDGTIRWYRASDGVELLALFVHAPDKRWVAWTPAGYYAASPGGEDFIGWHVNGRTRDDPADFFPASRFRDRFYRPDIVQLVLKTKDESRAIREANATAQRNIEVAFSRADLPPVVDILADPRGFEADTPEIDLAYKVRSPSGREVTRIEARIDGQLVWSGVPRGVSEAAVEEDGTRSIRIPLPQRDAEISIIAYHGDQAGEPASTRVTWTGPVKAMPNRRLFALLVGVSAYNDPGLKLNYADKDARDLADVLKSQEGKFFKKVDTTLLLNADATEDNIEIGLAELAEKAGPDDYTLVFMAGHGATRKNKFFFLPGSADIAEKRLAATSLSGGIIADNLSAMRGKVLFFIDACYSAGAIGVDMAGFVNSVTGEENAVMMYASSSAGEVSYEDREWENGAFTEALMGILSDPQSYNDAGEIVTDELAVALRKRVWKLTQNRQTPIGQPSRAVPPFAVAAR
jgi:WD40 repeat protein